MDTVLVGFEETEPAARALKRAADLAEAFHARLVVVSVTEPTLLPVVEPGLEPVGAVAGGTAGFTAASMEPAPGMGPPEPEELSRRQLERARAYLAPRGVEAEYFGEVGDPAERLLDLAEQCNADVIVVGHREHGFLDRLFLSRPVDDAVARRSARDVLLVR